jgi:hypothetical protein
MSHDKIKAAARERMAETGERYTAARRAVVTERRDPEGQAVAGQIPPPAGGYALAMSGEIHDWLAELHGSDPSAALRVVQALVMLMEKGASLGDPLVVSAADSWPWALMQALDRSYQERLDRLTAARRAQAAAATLITDIHDQATALEAAQAALADQHRRALEAGRPAEAEQAAGELAVAQQQIAQARQLLPGMIEARQRLDQTAQRLQARVDAWRVRKETLKAGFVAASSSFRVREAIAALGLADDDGDRPDEDGVAAVTAQMERALGQQGGSADLMELRPGSPLRGDIRILFAVEPPGQALLIAVLDGLERVEDQFPEAVMAAADMLRRIRAGQAPEAAAHTYADTRSFLAEFYPR